MNTGNKTHGKEKGKGLNQKSVKRARLKKGRPNYLTVRTTIHQ